jgi:hypothetical protein
VNYAEVIAKLVDEFGQPWTGTDTQARFDIARGPVHTAIDVFDADGSAIVSVHTLPPHHAAGTHTNHLEFAAGVLKGCSFVQWAFLPGDLARRHKPAPQFDITD